MTEVSPILHRADPSAQAIDPENEAMNQRLMSNWSYIACMAHLLRVLTHTLSVFETAISNVEHDVFITF